MDKLNCSKRIIILLLLLASVCVSCQKKEINETREAVSQNIARYISGDGWVYTCDYQFYDSGYVDKTLYPIVFNVINLRYRYNFSIIESSERFFASELDLTSPIQILGNGVSEETDHDMAKIAYFLGYGTSEEPKTADEIMAQDRSVLELNSLNKEIFFTLLDEAIHGEKYTIGKYALYPSYAMLNEQMFLNGYEFQIGYMIGWGNVDVIMIDVLYESEDTPVGYVQLSDLIENGTASAEQQRLNDLLAQIEAGIVENNDFCYGKSKYQNESISGIDLTRLYRFLDDINANNLTNYLQHS